MIGTITVAALAASGANNNIQVVFKNCAPFTNCMSIINNTQIDNARDIDAVMPMFNLIEYSNNYSKTSGSLWQHHRDELALTNAVALDNFSGTSALLEFKQKITNPTGDDDTNALQKMRPLKYLSSF